jgi:ABC-type lipoprotein release transport system permease subunit
VDLDRHFAQIPIHFARKALGLRADQVTQLGIVLQDPDVQDHVLKEARAQLAGNPDVVVRPWQRILPELYTFMQVDKGSNYVFQIIILLMAMFTIFNTVLMSALERKREFAMMLALGTPLHRVSVQLLVESILLGVVGAVCGVLLGSGASLALDGLSLAQWMGDGFEVGGFLVDPVLRPKLTMVTTVGLGTVMVLVVALMSLVPMARLRQLRISDVFR